MLKVVSHRLRNLKIGPITLLDVEGCVPQVEKLRNLKIGPTTSHDVEGCAKQVEKLEDRSHNLT